MTYANRELVEIEVPFPGFYESVLSHTQDCALEREAEFFAEDESQHPEQFRVADSDFASALQDAFEFRDSCDAMAKAYVESVETYISDELGLSGLKIEFAGMESPRYYNFESDRLFARIPFGLVRLAFSMSQRDSHKTFAAMIKDRFTSYDGFISHYPNDLESWLEKDISEYDINERSTLIYAALKIADIDFEHMRESVWQDIGEQDYKYVDDHIDWPEFESAILEKRAELIVAAIEGDDIESAARFARANAELIQKMVNADCDGITDCLDAIETGVAALPYRCNATPDLFD